MAEHAYQQREFDKSIKLYKEALAHTENDGKVGDGIMSVI